MLIFTSYSQYFHYYKDIRTCINRSASVSIFVLCYEYTYKTWFRARPIRSALTTFVEICKQKLDGKQYVGSLLTGLSKAFECLPNGLLISKLTASPVHIHVMFIMTPDHCCKRQQWVKIDDAMSEWLMSRKAAPQGSIMGPCLYAFTNYFLPKQRLNKA